MKNHLSKIATAVCLLALGAALSACGGGGSTPAPAPAPDHFAAYVGTWTSECSSHSQDVAVITTANSVMTLAIKTNYFDTSACTGPVVAVETSSSNISIASNGLVTAPVLFPPAPAPTSATFDKVTVTLPQSSNTITGTGVYTSTANGVAQICVKYSNGESTCTDSAVHAATTLSNAGIYITGRSLFLITSDNGVYTAGSGFTKQ